MEKLREPTNEERVEILQTLVDMNKNPRRNMMENIIEIDGETYEVRYGPASKYNITSSVRKEINELISANEDKFKTALRPILDNPKLIAEAIIEMNVVTSVKATEAQKTITTYDGPIDEKQLKKDTEKYLEKIQDTILAFKEYLEEDKTTLKEINEVYSKDYEQFREKRQDFIRQKNALEDPQGSEAKLLTQSIENANREMKEMLSDKKLLRIEFQITKKGLNFTKNILTLLMML